MTVITTPVLRLRRAEDAVTVAYGDVDLFRYVHRPVMDPFEGPKPYLHPVRTLAGDVVTGYRPHDHRWHKGVQMTASEVSGQNFWGGGSYVRDRGYVDLPNVGVMRHEEFTDLTADGDRARLAERLSWHTQGGEHWIDEERVLTVRDVSRRSRSWTLGFTTTLRNVRGAALEFGSPTTSGRENAGYTGLFWRGPRSFTGGEILAAGGRHGPDTMGVAAGWLAYVGRHDEVDRESTLVFAEPSAAEPPATGPSATEAGSADESGPACEDGSAGEAGPASDDGPAGREGSAGASGADLRPPTRWFVRNEPFAAVNPSFAFHEPLLLAPGGALRLTHRIVIADGAWDRERIESHLGEHPW